MDSHQLKNKYSENIIAKAKLIRLLICDVDGVLSDGKVYLTNHGDEVKSFNIQDGLGIKLLQRNHIDVAIITGRQSTIVEKRADELGISYLFQGQKNKQTAFDNILNQLKLEKDQVAHIGDDLPDLPLIKQSGLGISVADAYHFVRQQSDWVTATNGGQGAVREVSDLLLFAQDKLSTTLNNYLT